MKKASFGQRFWSSVLDTLIASVASWVLVSGLNLIIYLIIIFVPGSDESKAGFLAINGIFGLVLWVVLWAFYSFIMTGWKSATFGKMILKLKVVNEEGDKVSWGQAFSREILGKTIEAIFIYPLGYLWMLWDEKGQTWHDKIAKTFVVPS